MNLSYHLARQVKMVGSLQRYAQSDGSGNFLHSALCPLPAAQLDTQEGYQVLMLHHMKVQGHILCGTADGDYMSTKAGACFEDFREVLYLGLSKRHRS